MVERCTLRKPIMMVIPPGTSVTIPCPVHPKGHVLRSQELVWHC